MITLGAEQPAPEIVSPTADAMGRCVEEWETLGMYLGNFVVRDGVTMFPHHQDGLTRFDFLQFGGTDGRVKSGITAAYSRLSKYVVERGDFVRKEHAGDSVVFLHRNAVESYLKEADTRYKSSSPTGPQVVQFVLEHTYPGDPADLSLASSPDFSILLAGIRAGTTDKLF